MPQTRTDLKRKLDEIMDGPMSLDKAMLVAVLYHAGQQDKGGSTYLRHVLRVMEAQENEDLMVSAVFHDIVEDTEIEIEDLRAMGCSRHQIDTIDRLTKRDGEDYEAFIQRILPNSSARAIKIADIEDNLILGRLKNLYDLGDEDAKRILQYIRARNLLGGK